MIRTILAALEAPQRAASTVEAIVTAAEFRQAHVVFGLLTTVPLMVDKLAPFGEMYTLPGELRTSSCDDQQALLAMLPSGMSAEIIPLIDSVAFMPTLVRRSVPPADLIMIGAKDAWQIGWLRRHVTETLLLASGAPLILLPAGRSVRKVDHAVLGWKPGPSATRALRALTELAAPGARIDVVNVGYGLPDQPEVALAPVAAALERHGFVVETHSLRRDRAVAEMLTAFALDAGADLLAVGGYGHSRAREIVLGGVTRSLILDCRLPVMLVH